MTGSISYSRKALICLVFGIGSLACAILTIAWDAPVLLLAAGTLFLLCLISGAIAWGGIGKSGGRLVGKPSAAAGMVLAFLCLPLTFFQATG
jgi:hypothetical protein